MTTIIIIISSCIVAGGVALWLVHKRQSEKSEAAANGAASGNGESPDGAGAAEDENKDEPSHVAPEPTGGATDGSAGSENQNGDDEQPSDGEAAAQPTSQGPVPAESEPVKSMKAKILVIGNIRVQSCIYNLNGPVEQDIHAGFKFDGDRSAFDIVIRGDIEVNAIILNNACIYATGYLVVFGFDEQ